MNDVCAGKHGDSAVLAAEAVVESTCSFIVWILQRCNRGSECAGERLPQKRETVGEWVEGEPLGAGDGTTVLGLDECDLNRGIANLVEDALNGFPCYDGGAMSERIWFHTDRDNEITEGLGLARVGVGERIDRSQLKLQTVEDFDDTKEHISPLRGNWVAIDGARVTLGTQERIAASANRPLVTSLVNAGSAVTVEVTIRKGVVVLESASLTFKKFVGARHGWDVEGVGGELKRTVISGLLDGNAGSDERRVQVQGKREFLEVEREIFRHCGENDQSLDK
jgi:hypothetical protein